MSGVGHDSSEPSAGDTPAATSWGMKGETVIAADDMAVNASGNGKPIKRAFFVLRLGSLLAMASGLALIVALDTNESATVLWTAMAAFFGFAAVAGDTLLRWTLRRVQQERERTAAAFRDRQSELRDIATRDDLTQLQNRRFFYERLQEELANAERLRKPLSIAMIDVDDLKAINDEFGHQVGDVILSQFARALNHTVADNHVTARLGGDEFAIIMPGMDRRGADELVWKLWDQLAEAPVWENGHASIFLGVSVGIGGYPWGGTDLEEIIHWADAKLYANKLERKGIDRGRAAPGDTRLSSAVVEVLSTALDIRDKMTHRHARRVARMAAAVAREMRLSDEQVLEIEYAAALHDIGKIGVTDEILRKAAPLDDDEWREMRRHSELGYEILKGIDFLRNAAEIVFAHHERYDGQGYPRGLADDEIPLGARVFCVVDAYDAMTSRRPYRQAMSREQACIEIARHSGSQFDPNVVEAFLVMIRRSPEGLYEEQEPFVQPEPKAPAKAAVVGSEVA